jgi:hypothetical protein
MTSSLLPLSLAVALGAALTVRLMTSHGPKGEVQPVPADRGEMNRDIERRLDLVVNGPSLPCAAIRRTPGPLAPPDASPFTPRAQPCPSPERWREKP